MTLPLQLSYELSVLFSLLFQLHHYFCLLFAVPKILVVTVLFSFFPINNPDHGPWPWMHLWFGRWYNRGKWVLSLRSRFVGQGPTWNLVLATHIQPAHQTWAHSTCPPHVGTSHLSITPGLWPPCFMPCYGLLPCKLWSHFEKRKVEPPANDMTPLFPLQPCPSLH